MVSYLVEKGVALRVAFQLKLAQQLIIRASQHLASDRESKSENPHKVHDRTFTGRKKKKQNKMHCLT